MKKNKLLKTGALALGTVASIAAPIAAVVSCGSSEDFSHKVVIKTTWAANGEQIKALQETVAAYNKQKAADDFEVVVKHVEGGYGTAFTNDEKDIKIKHMSSVADAYIDYPDTVGRLKSIRGKDYSLDVTTGVNTDKAFDSRFYTDGQKTLPLALSTEMSTIDLPVLGKLIKAAVKNQPTTGIGKTALDAWKSSTDTAAINKIWGADTSVVTSANKVENFTDETLSDYAKLFEFAEAAQKAFGKTAESDVHVLGDDSPTNLAYILHASKNGDAEKDIYTDKTDSFISDPTVKATFKNTLTEIHDVAKTGALVLNGGGAYSSSDLTYHRMAIAIGSTAGYSHNYIKAGGDKTILSSGALKFNLSPYDKELVLDGGNIVTNDKYKNKILSSGTIPHSIVVSATDLTALEAAAAGDVEIFQVGKIPAATLTTLGAISGAEIANGKSYGKTSDKVYDTHIIVIPKANVKKVSDNGLDTLNKSEALFVPAPNTDGTTNKYALAQGPSFVGVKHGGQKDTELSKFLKWFYDPASRLQGKDSASTSSVVESFAAAASYVTPNENFAAYTGTANPWNTDKFGANHMTVEVFHNTGVKAYTNPVTTHSKSIRDQIETTMKETVQNNFHQGKDISVEDIYKDIVGKLQLDWNK